MSTVWRSPAYERSLAAGDGRGVGLGHDLRAPAGIERVDVNGLERDLEDAVRGEVLFDAGHRAIYSHDSSNYRQAPLGVVVPWDREDVVAAIEVCRRHGAPVLPRGCGTSLSGETTNVAVVIDTSKYLRRIHAIEPDERYAIVESGVVHDQLTAITDPQYHLTFAPDTSTHEYATYGGMIGNNSCGVHSVMAGRTSDNVHELEIVTYDGVRMTVGQTSEEELQRIVAEGGRKGEIYAALRDLRDRYADAIRAGFPDIPRRVSGYSLDELLPEKGFNVARALVGSEGTLATVLSAKVRLVYSPPGRCLLVIGYHDIFQAADHVPEIMEFGPTGLEALDQKLIDDMVVRGMEEEEIPLLPEGHGWLLVEFGGETNEQAVEAARRCEEQLRADEDAPDDMRILQGEKLEAIWEIRESGLGATAYVPMERDHWPGWEDAAVPPDREGDYLRDFRELLERHGYRAALYGHFGDGCVHCRINFDLRSAGGLANWRDFLEEAAELVAGYGGSLSGEHGDGQQRAELLEKMYGPELVQAMREFKAIWDPENRMNPHKVVDPYPIVSNLKLGANYNPPIFDTHFSYPEDGGSFAHAALRCVGAGKCRDTASGTMCPSYMVTLDEQHSTRGRARILYEMLQGDTIADGFRSDDVDEALDLCLSCKGCKGDCPVNVDMATYKAEFLARHHKRRLRPPEAYSMGLIMLNARLGQYVPRLASALSNVGLVKRLGGISPARELPPFARETFKSWWRGRGEVNPQADPVVLFPDTFNNYFHPEPLKATVEVLEAAGFRVVVPEESLCCGRPLYDYGMLTTARRFLERLVGGLRPWIREGVPVVGIEPSCVATFRDELVNMIPHEEDAKRLSLQTLTLAELLQRHAPDWEPPRLERRAIVHGHCHQEAVMGISDEGELLRRMGVDAEVLDSGCCGLAGSWGFEHDHHELSLAIGEHKLMPAVREAAKDTLVIADGFSCKTQVEQMTDRRPLHLAQAIRMAMERGPRGVPGSHPERAYPDVVLDGAGPTRTERALAAGAALAAAGGAALAAARVARS